MKLLKNDLETTDASRQSGKAALQEHQQRIRLRLALGSASAAELAKYLGLDQSGVSRTLASMVDELQIIGKARSARYSMRISMRNFKEFPIFSINHQGEGVAQGRVIPLKADQWCYEPAQGAAVLSDGLPWWLQDARPQGFLGRALAHRMAANLALPERVADWRDEHAMLALATAVPDNVGCWVVGHASLDQALQAAAAGLQADVTLPEVLTPTSLKKTLAAALEARANATTPGVYTGSSAAGEQPKFSFVTPAGFFGEAQPCNWLVKYSAPRDSAVGQRWADLLLAEHAALQTLAASEVGAARSEVVVGKSRSFLLVQRFDRHWPTHTGQAHNQYLHWGRSPVVSLGVLDDSFVGQRLHWQHCAQALVDRRLLAASDAHRIALAQAFGLCIGNNDMHFGNLSCTYHLPALPDIAAGKRLARTPAFSLAPLYDMLPMALAPVQGELRHTPLNMPLPKPELLAQWPRARELAAQWRATVQADTRVSDAFKQL